MANEVKLKLTIEDMQALKALAKLTKGVNGFEKEAKSSVSVVDRAFASFSGNIAAMGVAGIFNGAINGFKKLIAVGSDLVGAANVQEDAINALNTQLRIAGKFTQETSKDLQSFASQLQSVTKFGDEAIVSQLAFAQAMGASVDQSKSILTAATDMAASLNIDLNSAVRNISKTLGGYAGELGEVIPELKNLTAEQLQAGDGIELLAAKFAGAASDQIKTFSGATAQLSNTFGDLQEELGFTITNSPVFIAAIKGLEKGLSGLIKTVSQNSDSIRSFAEDVLLNTFALGAIRGASQAIIIFNRALVGTSNFFDFVADMAFATAQSILEFSSNVVGAASSLRKFFGLSTEGTEQFKKDIEKQVEVIKLARDANAEAVAQRSMDQQQLEDAVNGVTNTIINSVKSEVAAVQEKNAKIIESEIKKTEKIKELKQSEVAAQKAADLAAQEEQALKDILNEERFQKKLEKNAERFGAEQALEIEHQTRLAELRDGQFAANQKRKELEAKAEVKALKDQEKRNRDSFFAIADYQKLSNKQRVQNLQGTLGTIATLSSSSNKTLFNIGKAAGVANATIDGIAAVQKALASAPPPFNLALAALVGAATAANVAKLSAAKPPAFANGGVVGGFQGATGGGDNMNITARSGEMFLNGPQQRQLFEKINSGGSDNSDIVSAINSMASRPIMIEIEGRQIAQVVRDQRLEGFAV